MALDLQDHHQRPCGLSLAGKLFVFLALILLLVWLHQLRLRFPLLGQDEGILLAYPDLILRGYVPNRDFATLYPPGSFWSVAAFFAVFGPGVASERAVGLLFQVGILAAFVQISGRFGVAISLMAGIGLCSGVALFVPGAYSVLGSLAFGLWGIAFADRAFGAAGNICARTVALSGASTALALLNRQDVGLMSMLATMTYLINHRSWTAWRPYLFGFAIGSLPMVGHIIVAGVPIVFENLVLDVVRNAPGRSLPFLIEDLSLVLLCTTAILSCFIISSTWDAQDRDRALIKALGLFSIGLIPSILQRADAWHIGYGSIVLFPASLLVSAVLIRRYAAMKLSPYMPSLFNRTSAWRFAVVPLGIFLWIQLLHARPLWFALPAAETSLGVLVGRYDGVPVRWGGRSVPISREAAAEWQAVVASVGEIPRGNGIFVGPADLRFTDAADTAFYFLFPYLRPPYFLEMNPGVANRPGSRLAADVAGSNYLLLKQAAGSGGENLRKRPGDKVPNLVVERQFCNKAAIGQFRILRRCAKPAAMS